MGDINMIDQSGDIYAVPAEKVADRQALGWKIENDAQARARVDAQVEGDKYSGIGNTADAYGAAVWRGGTAGLSDVAARVIGGDETAEHLRGLQDAHGIASLIGEGVGTVAGGELLPAGQITKLGSTIARSAEGAGAIAKVGAAIGGGAVEGGLFGFGQGLSELALSDDPLTVERATSVLSSRALFGAAVGGGVGGVFKGAELGLTKAKGMLDAAASRSRALGSIPEDLAGLDAKGLRAAEQTERESLAAAQVTERSAAADEVTAYRAAVKEANPWLAVTDGEPAALLNSSDRTLRNVLNDPVGLQKAPQYALKPLRVQEQALERALADREAIAARLQSTNKKIARELGEELATLPDRVASVDLSGKAARRYGAFADVKVGKSATVTVSREDAAKFLEALESGAVHGEGTAALDKLGGLLEKNRALQARIEAAAAPKSELTSARLSQIADARDALSAGAAVKPSFAEQMLSGSVYGKVAGLATGVPVLGPLLGAKAAKMVTDLAFGRLGKATTEIAAKTSKAVQSFLDVTTKVAPVAPVLSSKVLSSVAFAPASKRAKEPSDDREPTLADHYKARAAELRSQTAYDAAGVPEMRQDARHAMADRLSPIRAAFPLLADRIETVAARRIEFLASKLPRRPELAGIGMGSGPDPWQPSDMEMRAFARYVAAVEDPTGVEHRLANGTVTPEDAEAMRAVYPERMAAITAEILAKLPTLQKQLPYKRRLALSIFTGVAVDPAMDPRVLSILQGQFAREEGTNGGTEAPRAEPAFGSVKKSAPSPTPAQDRSQGAQP